MKRVNQIRALTGLIIVSFLFTSILSKGIDPTAFFKIITVSDVSKNASSPVKSDSSDNTQLFDEEEGGEKSERDFGDEKFSKSQFDRFSLNIKSEFGTSLFSLSSLVYHTDRSGFPGALNKIPVFLSNHSIQV